MVTAESVERNNFRRAMPKFGGKVLGGGKAGVNPDVVQNVAQQITEVSRRGVEVCVVIGGGNFFRGVQLQQRGMDRVCSDYMGILGAVTNCLTLQDFLEQEGVNCRVQTAINMAQVSGPCLSLRAKHHLEGGHVIIFGTDMDMPHFSTDTIAVQRALEIGCEVLLMAKAVDGACSADPREVPGTELFNDITHRKALEWDLRVADATASPLYMDNNMPILVFNLLTNENIARAVAGEQTGILVHN